MSPSSLLCSSLHRIALVSPPLYFLSLDLLPRRKLTVHFVDAFAFAFCMTMNTVATAPRHLARCTLLLFFSREHDLTRFSDRPEVFERPTMAMVLRGYVWRAGGGVHGMV
ncbi:hypothetical protein C8R45DRAFT_1209257 [Mycena sanguinolenta]|nr:hypothetical protein C8R45DRAFT_1209243 [Mycena sanguinolenta]KAJ6505580.1 hypothetical protein C8R45DRAFT_1209257 [Mycena sanguinolenta]